MSVSDHDQDRQTVLDAFDKQIGWCEKLGSPFTARLLTILRDDIAAGGASAELALGWPGDPVADALALRMAGALRALALTGSLLHLSRAIRRARRQSSHCGPSFSTSSESI